MSIKSCRPGVHVYALGADRCECGSELAAGGIAPARSCDLCADNPQLTASVRQLGDGTMHLHARCHATAPLRLELEGELLRAYCYVPSCNRLVASFTVSGIMLAVGESITWSRR